MFEKITENVEIHQTLPDTPNMTTQELKKAWDKGNKIIKEAFNSLINELKKTSIENTVLYQSESGTTENITLSDNYDNYVKFDIYVKEGRIITCYNNSSNGGCNISYAKSIGVDTVSIQIKTQQIFFKDNNTITRGMGKTIGIGGSGQGVTQNIDENMIITKVIGYYKEGNNE